MKMGSRAIFGFISIAVGIGIVLAMGNVSTLDCMRSSPETIQCDLISEGLLGSQSRQIQSLEGAKLDTKISVDRNGNRDRSRDRSGVSITLGDNDRDRDRHGRRVTKSYRVLLLDSDQEIPLTSVYSSGLKDKEQTVVQINRFIEQQSQSTLMIEKDNRGWVYPIGGGVMVVGIGFLISAAVPR